MAAPQLPDDSFGRSGCWGLQWIARPKPCARTERSGVVEQGLGKPQNTRLF